MDATTLYNEKLLVLATMKRLIEKLRGELANLSTIEDRFPVPDHVELYGINADLDELEEQVDNYASGVEVLAK
jgi:tRNA(Ser,Leu) C12 N-acetylase TAN1